MAAENNCVDPGVQEVDGPCEALEVHRLLFLIDSRTLDTGDDLATLVQRVRVAEQ
jgi:hypothetical protein